MLPVPALSPASQLPQGHHNGRCRWSTCGSWLAGDRAGPGNTALSACNRTSSAVRLTELGLSQIDPSLLQAAHGLGASRWQRLRRIALPLALPSIMAGLNQSVMMALSMVASMIGARGLGEDVLAGIQTLNVGQGVEAGLAIVALAMVIDRISQAYGRIER